jgi:hypothetical protein
MKLIPNRIGMIYKPPERVKEGLWAAVVIGLMGVAMFVGCFVARNKWKCAIGAGIVMVVLAGRLVVKVVLGW